jgi:hypothetical protein
MYYLSLHLPLFQETAGATPLSSLSAPPSVSHVCVLSDLYVLTVMEKFLLLLAVKLLQPSHRGGRVAYRVSRDSFNQLIAYSHLISEEAYNFEADNRISRVLGVC